MEAATRADLQTGAHLVPMRFPIYPQTYGRWLYLAQTAIARCAFGCRQELSSPVSRDPAQQNRLWDVSVAFLEGQGQSLTLD